MDEPKTLLLRETGIARLSDGSEAINVGPIVVALGFLTEGRGEDRGTDEHGTPLPDLLSLAFDVVQSIIVGGRAAEYFRKVKEEFDAQSGLLGRSSLSLAKHAATVRPRAPGTALEKAASELRHRLEQLDELKLDDAALANLQQALQGFRDFGAERWVAATSHLLLALHTLDADKPPRRVARTRKSAPAKAKRTRAKAELKPALSRAKAKPRLTGKTPTKTKAKKAKAKTKAKMERASAEGRRPRRRS